MTRRGYDDVDPDQFARPARRTRPRTKERPAHRDATPARVLALDRGRYTCRVEDAGSTAGGTADADGPLVVAMRARALGRGSVVVGDAVRLVGDVSGAEGTLARIVSVEDRSTTLRRTADDEDPVERVIVANADQLGVVVALADPPPRPRLIDRCLVAAYDSGMDPLLLLTKSDLAAPDELVAAYRPLGVPYAVWRHDQDPAPVRERLTDRITVLVGHSGVGKSTVVNALVPGADRAIGAVSAVTGRGRHTSTQAVMVRLPGGGWLVDTPGVRSFGLAHVGADDLVAAFPDLDPVVAGCPRGCGHGAADPECALDTAIAAGRVERDRVDSYRRLLQALR